MIIAIFGISGVGKSHLTEQLNQHLPDNIATSASNLIKNKSGVTNPKKLAPEDIIKNQYSLIASITEIRKTNPKKTITIEMHTSLILEGKIIDIEKSCFLKMGIEKAIFLYEKPKNIEQRIQSDKSKHRELKHIDEIKSWQEYNLKRFRYISSSLAIPSIVVSPDKVAKIVTFISD